MVLEGRNLVLGYNGFEVIRGIDIAVARGDFITIVGSNGCGKSTILKALSRNLKPFSGAVYMNGHKMLHMNTKEVSRNLAFLTQSPSSPPQFTVRELVSYGRFPHVSWTGTLNDRDEEIVDWAIEATALEAFQHREIATLSGGERQRGWIAMALAQEAEILLLDEPTTFLDIQHQLQVLELIKKMNREWKRTIVMVLHDLNQASRFSERLVAIKNGQIYKEGSPDEIITEDTLKDVFNIKASILFDRENECPYFLPVCSA